MTTTVTCPGCGAFVPLGDRFCGACGTPITGSALMSGDSARFDPWEELLQKLRQATIGEYEIKGELGRGGMAAVLLAHDLQLNRKVAIKVMLPGLVYGASMWERFLSEARTAAKLDHPNIIYIHSVKEKDRFLYFVMKYIDGRTLDDILAQGSALPVPVAQTILGEVSRALDYAHNEGVVHRDIKPANIMIDQKGNSIVMDFGIARATDEKRFTQTGATIGTPAYMSPEQCRGNETTAASDQYSLGVLGYEMLTGAPPFVGTPIELQIAHMQDAPKSLRDVRPELSLELSGAIMRMLSKDPADRWPSLQQLVPIFSRGLDPDDASPRNWLITVVRDGAAQRRTFAATPVSPTPLSTASVGGAPALSGAGPTPASDAAARAGTPSAGSPALLPSSPTTAVSAAELAAHAQRMSMEASAVISGPHAGSVPVISVPIVTGAGDTDTVDTSVEAPRKRSLLLPIGAGTVLVAGTLWVLLSPRSDAGKATAKPPRDSAAANSTSVATPAGGTSATPIAPSDAAAAVQAALADSVVVGHGEDATRTVNGKAPRAVAPDAVSLALLSMSRPRVFVGDTIRLRLELQDDSGLPVTTHQVVWTTSNPRALKFLAPGQLLAAAEGRVTVTATTGSGTPGSLVVKVEPRSAAPQQKRTNTKKS